MDIDNFLIKHLVQTYSEKGIISERINKIFIKLNVDKNLAINAFFEMYGYPEYFERTLEYKIANMPSYSKLIQSIQYLPEHYLDRLAFAFILYDLTYNRLHYPSQGKYNYKLIERDIRLALDNISIINFDLGIVFEYLNEPAIGEAKEKIKSPIHALGGLSRAKKYEVVKLRIYRDWELNPSSSYAEFARKYSEKYNLSTKTIENWLSRKFSKPRSINH